LIENEKAAKLKTQKPLITKKLLASNQTRLVRRVSEKRIDRQLIRGFANKFKRFAQMRANGKYLPAANRAAALES